jgi:hypothetical protein
MDKKLASLLKFMAKTQTEEDVKAAWAKCFNLDDDTSPVLSECKYDKPKWIA